MSAFKEQVGGNHYTKMAIQPAEYCFKNNIGKLEGDAIAYLSRWKDKNGLEDLKKARHTIDLLIELEVSKRNDTVNMQGNDPKVNICDSMNLADSFLYDMRQTELSWNEHHEARMDVIGQNGPTGEHYDNEKEQRIDAAIENLSKFADQDDGWIQNKDEVQPVPNKCKVDVRFASGVVGEDAFAGSLYWGLCDGDASIVAYRIRNEIYNDDEESQV